MVINPKCFYLESECKKRKEERVMERKEKAKQGIRWHHLYYIISMPSLGSRLGDLSLVGVVLSEAILLSQRRWYWTLGLALFEYASQQSTWEAILHLSKDPKYIEMPLRTLGHTLCQASLSTDLISRLRLGRGWFPVIPYSWLPPPVHSLHLIQSHCSRFPFRKLYSELKKKKHSIYFLYET